MKECEIIGKKKGLIKKRRGKIDKGKRKLSIEWEREENNNKKKEKKLKGGGVKKDYLIIGSKRLRYKILKVMRWKEDKR